MKNKTIILGLVAVGLGLYVWKNNVTQTSKPDVAKTIAEIKGEKKIIYYTCSMHPQIHADHPGNCPICGMTLIPVYEESSSSDNQSSINDHLAVDQTVKTFSISGERQELIGIKKQKAEKSELKKEISTVGVVAYDPDLAIAIREYQSFKGVDSGLLSAAETKLKLLGLSSDEIKKLNSDSLKKNDAYYLPQKDSKTGWIYATLFESDLPFVESGMEVKVFLPWDRTTSFDGIVRSIDPTINEQTRATKARIEITSDQAIHLKPNMYVNVIIEKNLGSVVNVPRDAVMNTGADTSVFVVNENNQFEKRHVALGGESGDKIAITSGLDAGETVVVSSNFLVDSEAQLKGN